MPTTTAKRPTRRAQAAKRTPPISPSTRELGAPGSRIFGPSLSDDYNAELNGPEAYRKYDVMRRGDGQVRAALSAVKLPILRAYWRVEPASDSPEDKAIAERADRMLETIRPSWISTMRQALLMLDYGSIPFELVWKVGDDGLIEIAKFAPRLPGSIMEWQTNRVGDLLAIKQGTITGLGTWVETTIQRDKLILFVNEQEGANYRGISILRAAYKHWYYKENLYKVDAIAKEKRALGVDVGTLKSGNPDKARHKDELEQALMTLHAAEKQFFIEDEDGFSYRIEAGGDAIADAMPSIEHHDLRIIRSILVEFLGMGAGSTGSLAMHKDKSAFFLMVLEAVCDYLADVWSSEFLRPWVDFNWRVKDYPRFRYSRLDTRTVGEIADAVQKLVSVGALTADDGIQDELRAIMDFPERSPEDAIGVKPVDQAVVEAVETALAPVAARQISRMLAQVDRVAPTEIRPPYRSAQVAAVADNWAADTPDHTAIRAKMVADLMAGRLKAALVAGIAAQDRQGTRDLDDLKARLEAAVAGAVGGAMAAAA